MKDVRGIEIKKGNDVIVTQSIGGWGAHAITVGDVTMTSPNKKFAEVHLAGYWKGDADEYKDFYRHEMTVVDLPPVPKSLPEDVLEDERGVELKLGQTVMFSLKTGDYGEHVITKGTIVKICPKTVKLAYKATWRNTTSNCEGNYRPEVVIVVNLPTVS